MLIFFMLPYFFLSWRENRDNISLYIINRFRRLRRRRRVKNREGEGEGGGAEAESF